MQQQSSGGISFLGLLAILFIGMKLGNIIQWPWWLVLLPLWGPLGLVIAVLSIVFVIWGIASIIVCFLESIEKRERRKRSEAKR